MLKVESKALWCFAHGCLHLVEAIAVGAAVKSIFPVKAIIPNCMKANNVRFVNIVFTILLLTASISSCKISQPMSFTQVHAFRLKPGQDLKESIQQFVVQKQISAGWISTGVGSLTNYKIRFANQEQGSSGQGHQHTGD